MWSLFKREPRISLGIDLGVSSIKLVEIEKQEERWKLKNYGIFSLTDYFSRTGEVLDPLKIRPEELARIIKKIILEAGIVSKRAYMSVPVFHIFSTLIDLPLMPEAEVAAAIPYEAKKYIPGSITDVVLDWYVVSPPGAGDKIQVFLVAIPNEVVEQYKRVIQLAGLSLEALEVETFSLLRSIIGNDKTSVVVVDSGSRSTNISLIDNGYIKVIYNLEIGGAEITNIIAEKSVVDLRKAEELKIKKEIKPTAQADIDLIFSRIAAEIKKVILNYETKYNRKIDRCILAGGGSSMAGFKENLTNKLQIEVLVGNPFARLIYPSALEGILKELGPSLTTAIGLAMAVVNKK